LHQALNQTRQAEAATVRYVTDANRSKFTVRAFATGFLSAFGHNPTIAIPDFSGEALVDPESLPQSSLHLVIQAASLTVQDDVSDKDRDEMNRRTQEEVLESANYPEIVYQCSRLSASKTGEGQYWASLNGELSLHGVTRLQAVSTRVSLNGDSLHAAGEFSLLQSDYGIRLVSAAAGAVKLKDELKLSFDIWATRKS
jgi:polyisoprenoid-binding protein YceI